MLILSRGVATLRRHYEGVIESLVRDGVEVRVRHLHEVALSASDFRESLAQRGCAVAVARLDRYRLGRRDRLGLRLRQLVNLLRFEHADYRGREWLRDAKLSRAARSSPGARRWARRIGRLGRGTALRALRAASALDRLLPPPEPARRILAEERPDAVAVVGIVFDPALADFVKAAAWQGIPSAIWVQSWDNLTNKGLLHATPDRVFVWNEFQRAEVARYHGMPESRVCVTGAQSFDHWFEGPAPATRERFCAESGLDPERPIVLYLASSLRIEPPLEDFFLRWLDAIRSSGDPVLEGASVLVRPHPTALEPWRGLDRSRPRLAVSPSVAADSIDGEAYRLRYRNELHHASVAVGLNTTGMIDAAIVGKPVCTVELPDLPDRQRGTIHFEYLTSVGGGFVRTATSLAEHAALLGELVRRDPYARDDRAERFVHDFVRPHGVETRPTDTFAREMRALLGRRSEAPLPSRPGRAAGWLLRQAGPVVGVPLEEGPVGRWIRRRKPLAKWAKGRARLRARLKPVRHLVLVHLRAALRARIERLTRRRARVGQLPFKPR